MTEPALKAGRDHLIVVEAEAFDAERVPRADGRQPTQVPVSELCESACELLLEAAQLLEAAADRSRPVPCPDELMGLGRSRDTAIPRLGWFG